MPSSAWRNAKFRSSPCAAKATAWASSAAISSPCPVISANSANQDYTLIALRHQGQNSSYRTGHTDPFDYSNQFETIPNSVPFRPPRLGRKPVIPSTQTALVVGQSGEEIWTDQYGRIKVQFFWDRVGTKDDNSSCWIRVAQGWAGNNGAPSTSRASARKW